jgi:hypothetical protein
MLTLWVRKEDYTAAESWRLVEWCAERGARDFTLSFIGPPDLPSEAWNAFDVPLAPFALSGSAVGRFALTPDSIALLRSLLRDGLFTNESTAALWLEDPTLYRDEDPILSVISHEGEAILELEPEDRVSLDAAKFPYRLESRWA